MIFDGSDSEIRNFYYLACKAVACICVVVYLAQWFFARRAASNGKNVDIALAWDVWSLRTVRSFFYGAGFMFIITPFGYGFVDGMHGFSDCAAFSMPCLAGMVVGLALLRKRHPLTRVNQGKVKAHPLLQISPYDADGGPTECKHGIDPGKAGKGAKKCAEVRSLELIYYIASVLIIIVGYVNYIIAHPSNAIAVFVVLGFGWFALGWLAFIWGERIGNSRKENFFGFVLLIVLLIGLFCLSRDTHARWSRLLPDPCDEHEDRGCQVEHCADKKAENHVILGVPLSASGAKGG